MASFEPVSINQRKLEELYNTNAIKMENAMNLTDEARVICEVEPPHTIVHANKAWCLLTGYSQQEVLGGVLECLQGLQVHRGTLRAMLNSLNIEGQFHEKFINCKKSGEQYPCQLQILPVIEADIDPMSNKVAYCLSLFSVTLQMIPWGVENSQTAEISGDFDTPDETNSPDDTNSPGDTNSPDGSDSQEESSSGKE